MGSKIIKDYGARVELILIVEGLSITNLVSKFSRAISLINYTYSIFFTHFLNVRKIFQGLPDLHSERFYFNLTSKVFDILSETTLYTSSTEIVSGFLKGPL